MSKSNFASLFSRTRISLSNLCLVSDRVDDNSAFSATTLSRDCFSLLVSCFSDSAASSCSFIWPCNFLFSSFRPLVESEKSLQICSPCTTFSQQIVLLISMFKDYYNSSSPWHGWLVNKLQQITRQLCYFRKIKYPNQLGNYTLNKCESLIKLGSYLLVFRRKTIS